MSYTEIVHRGKDMAAQHMVWLVPALLVSLLGYIWVTNKIMASKPSSAARAEPS